MATKKQKKKQAILTDKNFTGFILAFFSLLLVTTFILYRNSYIGNLRLTNSSKNNEPVSKLSNEYILTNLDDNSNLLTSTDFNASIQIPKNATVSKGFAFDPSHPESETKSIGINLYKNQANAVLVMETGFKSGRDVYNILEEETKKLGPRIYSYSPIKARTINNANGFETYGVSKDKTYLYYFITDNGDKYLKLWYIYPWNGFDRTGQEEQSVKAIIASFKQLAK